MSERLLGGASLAARLLVLMVDGKRRNIRALASDLDSSPGSVRAALGQLRDCTEIVFLVENDTRGPAWWWTATAVAGVGELAQRLGVADDVQRRLMERAAARSRQIARAQIDRKPVTGPTAHAPPRVGRRGVDTEQAGAAPALTPAAERAATDGPADASTSLQGPVVSADTAQSVQPSGEGAPPVSLGDPDRAGWEVGTPSPQAPPAQPPASAPVEEAVVAEDEQDRAAPHRDTPPRPSTNFRRLYDLYAQADTALWPSQVMAAYGRNAASDTSKMYQHGYFLRRRLVEPQRGQHRSNRTCEWVYAVTEEQLARDPVVGDEVVKPAKAVDGGMVEKLRAREQVIAGLKSRCASAEKKVEDLEAQRRKLMATMADRDGLVENLRDEVDRLAKRSSVLAEVRDQRDADIEQLREQLVRANESSNTGLVTDQEARDLAAQLQVWLRFQESGEDHVFSNVPVNGAAMLRAVARLGERMRDAIRGHGRAESQADRDRSEIVDGLHGLMNRLQVGTDEESLDERIKTIAREKAALVEHLNATERNLAELALKSQVAEAEAAHAALREFDAYSVRGLRFLAEQLRDLVAHDALDEAATGHVLAEIGRLEAFMRRAALAQRAA